uniref:UBA domain-containing protein n=1 Tax=Ascaris lumbricoides TaxID=6252 RepID=A0A0M3HU98_ASCLU
MPAGLSEMLALTLHCHRTMKNTQRGNGMLSLCTLRSSFRPPIAEEHNTLHNHAPSIITTKMCVSQNYKMHITVTTDASGANVFPVEVGESMEMENFLALCQLEVPSFSSIAPTNFIIAHNGRIIHMNAENLKKTFKDLGIVDTDIVMVSPRPGATKANKNPQSQPTVSVASASQRREPTAEYIADLVSAIKVPTTSSSSAAQRNSHGSLNDTEISQLRVLFNELTESPDYCDRLRRVIPTLVEAAEKRDFGEFCNCYVADRERVLARQRAMLDPMSAEGQRLIAEQIQRENIDFSHQFALEHMPEAYIPVTMLYINMKINGEPVKAFVDSGAQVSILSERVAIRCNLMRLVDERFQGVVHGVGGAQRLLGKIHTCQVQVEGNFFPCNFDVLADRDIDVLLGLDILRRHQCVIDLNKNCLRFGESTVTPFLNEADIPKRDGDKAGTSARASNVEVDSAKLASLMSLGFEEAASRAMLIQCGNDLELAAANLLARQTTKS